MATNGGCEGVGEWYKHPAEAVVTCPKDVAPPFVLIFFFFRAPFQSCGVYRQTRDIYSALILIKSCVNFTRLYHTYLRRFSGGVQTRKLTKLHQSLNKCAFMLTTTLVAKNLHC